jgi:histidine triad (HIT) family protein
VADCIFCKIVAGEVASRAVASTEFSYAFLDINPVAPVHVLVVPKEHFESFHELSLERCELLADLWATIRAVAEGQGIAASGYRVVANVGEDALASVPHLHFHVIGGRRLGWPPG